MTPQLTLPDAGITDGTVLLRMPVVDDVDALLPSFADPELREAGNLPDFDRPQMLAMLPQLPALAASGRLLPLIALDPRSGDCVGGGTLHHLDAERSIIEIGYWVLPAARRRGHATRIARLLAEHAFSLGVIRVAAYVNVGNVASERVLERAGFVREGVVRSMPVPSGARIDKTLFSCLDSTSDDEKAFTRQRHRSMGDNMSSVDVSSDNATGSPPVKPGEMRLEVVVVPVSDVDRAKALLRVAGLAARRRPRRGRRLPGGAAHAPGLRLLDHLRRRASRRPRPARPRVCSSRSTTSTRPAPTWSRAGSTSASRSTT